MNSIERTCAVVSPRLAGAGLGRILVGVNIPGKDIARDQVNRSRRFTPATDRKPAVNIAGWPNLRLLDHANEY
jgi:hypothetical protein